MNNKHYSGQHPELPRAMTTKPITEMTVEELRELGKNCTWYSEFTLNVELFDELARRNKLLADAIEVGAGYLAINGGEDIASCLTIMAKALEQSGGKK